MLDRFGARPCCVHSQISLEKQRVPGTQGRAKLVQLSMAMLSLSAKILAWILLSDTEVRTPGQSQWGPCPTIRLEGWDEINPCGRLPFLFNVWRPFQNLRWASELSQALAGETWHLLLGSLAIFIHLIFLEDTYGATCAPAMLLSYPPSCGSSCSSWV